MKQYIIISSYDIEDVTIIGVFDDKKVAIEKSKYFARSHKSSISVIELEQNIWDSIEKEVYSAYWCYYGYIDKPSVWKFYEKEEGCKYVKIKEIVENGR